MATGATADVDTTIANGTITSGTAVGRVVSVDSTNRFFITYQQLIQLETLIVSSSNTVHAGSTSGSLGSKGTISSVSAVYPEVQRNSGDIVYLENRGAVARAV